MVPGGLSGVRAKDAGIEEIIGKIKPALEEQSHLKFDSIEPLIYRHQIVAGMNYFIKVSSIVLISHRKQS